MKEGELFKNSEFNWNNTGGPQLKKVATGAEFQNTIMPVIGEPIKVEKGPDYFDMTGAVYVFENPVGKPCDFYARVQIPGIGGYIGGSSEGWFTIPFDITTALTIAGINYMDIKTIDKDKIEFVSGWAFASTMKFEIYFVDFSI